MPMSSAGFWATTEHCPTRTMLSTCRAADALCWNMYFAAGGKAKLQAARLGTTQDGAAITHKRLELNAMSQVNAVRTFHLTRVPIGPIAGVPRGCDNIFS